MIHETTVISPCQLIVRHPRSLNSQSTYDSHEEIQYYLLPFGNRRKINGRQTSDRHRRIAEEHRIQKANMKPAIRTVEDPREDERYKCESS